MNTRIPISNSLAQITDRPASLRWRWAFTAAVFVFALALSGCQRNADPQPLTDELSRQPVRTAAVESADDATTLRLPGVTRAIQRAELAFLQGGHLAERRVRRGEQVSAGDVVAVLHNPALMPGVESAQARVREIDRQIEQLERETQRLERLHERGLVATDDLDRTRSRRDALSESRQAAASALDEARDQLKEGSLRAPFSGQVVALLAEPGQHVAAGQPIVSMVSTDRLEVAVNVPARLAGMLSEGHPVTVQQADQAATLTAEITEVGPAGAGHPAEVIVSLPAEPAPNWRTGLPVQVTITFDGDTLLSVPMAAVIRPASGSPRVFRINGDTAERIEVIPGSLRDGRVTVNGRLEAGDEVVVAGHGRLLDGDPVRVLP